jgi:hypothetical protein
MQDMNKMNLGKVIELAEKKGFWCYSFADTWSARPNGTRAFITATREGSNPNRKYDFLFSDWLPTVRVKTNISVWQVEITSQFIEDCATMRMIADSCWEG